MNREQDELIDNEQKKVIETIGAGWKPEEILHHSKFTPAYFIKTFFNILGPIIFIISFYFGSGSGVLDKDSGLIVAEGAPQIIALAIWMLIWWITEFVPLPATALLPIIILPTFNTVPIKDVVVPYSSSIIYLFLGGFLIALALEKWGLHKRIALSILKVLGASANNIVLGFIIASAFLSMWISNTATAVMLLPIVTSVIAMVSTSVKGNEKGIHNLKISMLLGVAFGASVGGMGTLIGTPPNAILAGYINTVHNVEIDFFGWMLFSMPIVIIVLTITYFLITKIVYPSKLGRIDGFDLVMKKEIEDLGPVKREDKIILSLFVIAALLWMLRSLINKALGINLNDSSIAIIIGLSFFFIPSQLPSKERLLEWKDTSKLPWGILLLFGGGLSIAAALEASGVLLLFASIISGLHGGIPITAIILILMVISVLCTEFMSNTALATIFAPIIASIGFAFGYNELVFTAPFILAISCVFNLPMGTPPNAVIFASGQIRIADMIRVGAILSPICIIIITLIAFELAKIFLI